MPRCPKRTIILLVIASWCKCMGEILACNGSRFRPLGEVGETPSTFRTPQKSPPKNTSDSDIIGQKSWKNAERNSSVQWSHSSLERHLHFSRCVFGYWSTSRWGPIPRSPVVWVVGLLRLHWPEKTTVIELCCPYEWPKMDVKDNCGCTVFSYTYHRGSYNYNYNPLELPLDKCCTPPEDCNSQPACPRWRKMMVGSNNPASFLAYFQG